MRMGTNGMGKLLILHCTAGKRTDPACMTASRAGTRAELVLLKLVVGEKN